VALTNGWDALLPECVAVAFVSSCVLVGLTPCLPNGSSPATQDLPDYSVPRGAADATLQANFSVPASTAEVEAWRRRRRIL
jgi:hypothetical protein